ncbi:MAG: site-2 protease family protein [Candidatus Aminicenantales bacterium]
MKHAWKIARIAGIDIYVDSSWFVIFILFTWILSTSYFPHQHSGWRGHQYWTIGLLTSLLIFISVLIHELAHSVVAKAQGEEVRRITLFILGGVAQITEEPKQPLQEFVMAVVGPLTSLGLSAAFFLASMILLGLNEFIGASLSYLALINLILAVFNLLPGFPMDGGRVLRSLIWKATGNLKKSTSIASKVGQGFAFLLIFLGIVQILRANLGGLWLVFIGWFLHSSAVRGYQQLTVDTVLRGVRARELMREDFERVSGNLLVQELVDDYILHRRERVFLVSDNGHLQGIVCLEDVKATPRDRWSSTTVREIMTPKEKLLAVSPDDDGNTVLKSLTSRDVHQVPVMEGGQVAGVVCRSDILRYIQLRSELGI